MKRWVPTPEAYQLLHEGALALSQVEAEGVRVDKAHLDKALDDTARQVREHEDAIRADPAFKLWRRRFGSDTKISVNAQLKKVVFEEMGLKSNKVSRGAAYEDKDSAEEGEFEGIDIPLVKNFFAAAKMRKARSTYLTGIQRELVRHDDGNYYIHPHYHLNRVSTFRSSCSDPNWTNVPNRNPLMAEIIRRCYIARPGQQLLECDYGQIEVRVPCFYSFDPVLMSYNSDTSKDMHRETAEKLFMCSSDQVSKEMRHAAKNKMVFPTFYGSYYKQTAPSIWESIVIYNLKLKGSDKTVREHLAEKGITEVGDCDPDKKTRPGTFEAHVGTVEQSIKDTFKVHWQWKEKWIEQYRREGGCRFLTGFVMVGAHARNDIPNYPVQSVAFHLTLWSLIRLNKLLRHFQFKTRIIGEVHDCINFDGPPSERNDVVDMAVQVMTQDVLKHWPWVNVPLTVEPEACPYEGAWFDKSALVLRDTQWQPSDLAKWESKFGVWS